MNQQYLFVFYFKTALPNFLPASRYWLMLLYHIDFMIKNVKNIKKCKSDFDEIKFV
jgi:hypothetical protein